MRRVGAWLVTVGCVTAGCAPWEGPATQQRRPVTSAPATAPTSTDGLVLPIGPAASPWVVLSSAVDADRGTEYRFHEQSPELQRYSLQPTSGPAPSMSAEVHELADGTVIVAVDVERAVRRLWLRGESPAEGEPIRLHADDSLLAAVGRVSGGFDGLLLPGGRLLQVDGRVHWRPASGRLAVSVEVPAGTSLALATKLLAGPTLAQTAPAPPEVPASAPDPLAEPAPEPSVWHQLAPWLTGLLTGGPAQPLEPGLMARLSPEQARLVAAAAALRGLDLSSGTDAAASEQVAQTLRSTTRPAEVRLLDHLPRPVPAAAINVVIGGQNQYQTVGLFNITDRFEHREIEPEHFLVEGLSGPVGVWDPWHRELLRIDSHAAWNREGTAAPHVRLPLPPRSSRVFQLAPLLADQPTVLPPSGSPVQSVQWVWDAEHLALSGEVGLAAFEPLELAIYVPYGASFELDAVQAESAVIQARVHGPLRILTLEADRAGVATWRAGFRRASRPLPAAPATPAKPLAQQNTRGVLLSWPAVPGAVLYRVLRDGRPLAEVEGISWQDSTCAYNRAYTYAVQSLDVLGRASAPSAALDHRTPAPASTNLTQLVPLWSDQDRFGLGIDLNTAGGALRVAGQRFYRGLGTHANSTVRYYLGGGYHEFSGVVGVDEAAGRDGSVCFEVRADGVLLWSTEPVRAGQPPTSFSVNVSGRHELELIARDAGDGITGDYADWANVYLRVAR